MSEVKPILEINKEMTFKDILFHIRMHGYGYIGFNYSGGGDSGSIDEVYLVPKELASQDDDGQIVSDYSHYELENKSHHRLSQEITRTIEDNIYSHILDDAPDWYNNDGGGGHGYICTENGDFSTDHYVNVVHQEEEVIKGNILE